MPQGGGSGCGWPRAVAPAALIAVLVAGCGGSAGAGSSSATGNGEVSRAPEQILRDAAAALGRVHSFELAGLAKVSSVTGEFTVDYEVPDRLHIGVATHGDGNLDLIAIGTSGYVRGDASFWKQEGVPTSAIGSLAGRWVALPSTTPGLATLTSAFTIANVGHCLVVGHGSLRNGGRASVDGHPAVVVVDAGDRPGTTPGRFFVAASGAPLPLRIDSTGNTRAGGRADARCQSTSGLSQPNTDLTFSHYDQHFAIAAPAGAVPLSQIAAGG